jgi:hypothetical protein
MSDTDTKPLPDSDVTLNLRAIMSGREIGSIIGRGGETINSIREESGANIYISDGSLPERLVAVKGPTDSVYKAYTRICKKLEENEERSMIEPRSYDNPRLKDLISILIEWVNDELHGERIIVQDVEEDLYDGQVQNLQTISWPCILIV